MVSRGLPIVLALSAAISGVVWGPLASGQAPSMPAVSAPPRQMAPYGVPPSYPSTDPSVYPVLSPSAYPSTAAATSPSPALPPNETSTFFAAGPDGFEAASGPALAGGAAGFIARSSSGSIFPPYSSPDATTAAADSDLLGEPAVNSDEPWMWQILPTGLLYQPYLASTREPRLGSQLVYERNQGLMLDSTLGGRVGLLRYGTSSDIWPQGWQLDVEGAAFPRLDDKRNLVECDYRAGVPLTTRQGPWELKLGYVHYCAHIGDLYLLDHPDFQRINYVRDAIVWGVGVYPRPDLRLYAEAGWGFHDDGGAEPWEFQFGADFSSLAPTGPRGVPFLAINGHLRQANDFAGNLTVQTGWQWRGCTGHSLRIGVQYFNGMSEEGQFYDKFEEQIGGGIWYDF